PPPPPPKEKDLRDSKSEKVDKKKEKPVLHPVQQNVFPASMQPPQIPSMPPPQLAPMSQLSDQLDIQ
ncbi:hypothetical protein Bpfe_003174, partial [Biomphalaria pfeifferi]